MTEESVPDYAVTILKATAHNSSSIVVSWNITRPVTGPTYSFVEVNTVAQDQDPIFSGNTEEEEIAVSGLLPYTTYRVTVIPRVHGVDGFGPIRHTDVTTKQGRPTSPVDGLRVVDVTASSVFLEWMQPRQSNGIIAEYKLSLWPGVSKLRVKGSTTSVNITDLLPFSSYNVTISSKTVVGQGPEARIEVTTLQAPPSDPPQDVKVYNVTATSAFASWSPPSRPNGILVKYLVEFRPAEDVKGGEERTLNAQQRVLEMSNLLPYTTYFLSVRAATEAGIGELSSEPKMFTTMESVPGIPLNVTCTAISEHHILVQWFAPRRINGVLTNYAIDYSVPTMAEPAQHVDIRPTKNEATLRNMTPYTNYTIGVKGLTAMGDGRSAYCHATTMQGYPGPPTQLQVSNVTKQSMTAAWQPPARANGVISGYSLVYSPYDSCQDNGGVILANNTDEVEQCAIDVGPGLSFTVSHLRHYARYVISVKAATKKGFGSLARPAVEQHTTEGVPEFPPRKIRAVALSSTSIDVTWDEPYAHSGMTRYQVTATRATDLNVSQSNILDSDRRQFVMTGLSKYSIYNITVAAVTSAGSMTSLPVEAKTLEDVPSDTPNHVTVSVISGNSTSANIFFLPPLHPNGRIVSFTIQHNTTEGEAESAIIPRADLSDPSLPGQPYNWIVNHLLGGKGYRFKVRAHTKVGPGPWSQWTDFVVLPVTAPPLPYLKPALLEGRNGEAASSLTVGSPCVFSEVNGPISSISIIVVEEGADRNNVPTTWKKAYVINPSPPYKVIVTLDPARDCGMSSKTGNANRRTRQKRTLTSDQRGFVLGADTSCGNSPREYCNGVLKPDTSYRVKYRAEVENGAITDTEYSEPLRTNPDITEANINLIIGIVVPVIVFLIVLIISAIFMKRRRGHSIQKPPESDFTPNLGKQRIIEQEDFRKGPIVETHSNSAFLEDTEQCDKVVEGAIPRQIPELEFASHVARLSLSKNKGFSDEFDDIRGLPIAGTTASADKPCNRTKNRYSKLVPFDQFRVKLEGTASIEGSDYINASYLPGQRSVNQFIATQTPLEHTKRDFWRMLWETGASSIAMMGSNGKGKKREEQFWPGSETEHFGSVSVQLIREDLQPDWSIRYLAVHAHGQSRNVTSFHLSSWPVSDTPFSAQVVLKFVDAIRLDRGRDNHPLVVVCSSGSGRAAVLIAIYRMLNDLSLNSHLDCFGVVAAMRRYRPYMVQTLGEYILIHRCMLEAVNTRLGRKRPPTGDGMEETIF